MLLGLSSGHCKAWTNTSPTKASSPILLSVSEAQRPHTLSRVFKLRSAFGRACPAVHVKLHRFCLQRNLMKESLYEQILSYMFLQLTIVEALEN